MTYNNGTSIGYDYENKASDDDLGNRLEQLDNNIGGTHIKFDYTYDKVGNKLTMVVDDTDTHNYDGYDNIYQLTSVDYPTGSLYDDTDFVYDALGNRLTMDDGTLKTYQSNNLNQYTTNGDGTYSYNSNGNLTGDGSYTYAYDSQNRLVSIASLAVYEYDWLGRRIAKTIGGVRTEYVYDGDQVIAEYDDSGGSMQLARKFIYGPGIDEPICMIDVAGGGALYYYHFDGLGSVVALSDNAGAIVERYEYSAYGQTQILSPSHEPRATSDYSNPYMFTGRRLDDETGLYYYRARMYHPELGRFMQPDPIGYLGGLNLYAYVKNNPLKWIDPWGLVPKGTECNPKRPGFEWYEWGLSKGIDNSLWRHQHYSQRARNYWWLYQGSRLAPWIFGGIQDFAEYPGPYGTANPVWDKALEKLSVVVAIIPIWDDLEYHSENINRALYDKVNYYKQKETECYDEYHRLLDEYYQN